MKKNRFIYLLFICIGIAYSGYAQIFPDYKERSYAQQTDTTNISNGRYFILPAADGSIDPSEYIVGPGDKLLLSISGLLDLNSTLAINQEGMLFIPKVGLLDLRDLTLEKAKEKIIAAVNKYYKDVDVYVSLIDLRNIKVSLIGEVKRPSSFVLQGNARLADLIFNSVGLDSVSDFRNIKIQSKQGISKYYDLLYFLRNGDRLDNPMLREGDVVVVKKIDELVAIKGEVNYPGIYEYVKGETVEHLIKLAGGFTSKAKKDTLEVVKFENNGSRQISYYFSYEELIDKKITLDNRDVVLVREIPRYLIDRFVQVRGWVKYPGFYKILENKTTLTDIINKAGGFLPDASLNDASLYRTMGTVEYDPEFERLKTMQRKDMSDDEYDYFKAKSRQQSGKVVIDFKKLFADHDTSENIILKKGDSVYVPEAKNYIIMLGQVVNPGNVIYQKGLSVDDYIKYAGGFGWRAETGDVRVIRANSGEWIDADKVDSLNPGDEIWVPEQPPSPKFWTVFTTSLQVVGQLASIVAATVAVIIATRK